MPIPPPAALTAFFSGISAMESMIPAISMVMSPSGTLVFPTLETFFTDGEGIIPCKLSAARRTFSRIAAALGFQDTADLFLCLMALLCKIFSLNRQPRLPGKLEVQIQHLVIAFQIIQIRAGAVREFQLVHLPVFPAVILP